MNMPVLTLGSVVELLIGAVVVVLWIIGALSKVKGASGKSVSMPVPDSTNSVGDAPTPQVSAQDRLRTLSEQRRAQLQEIVRRRSGGLSTPPPPLQRDQRLDSVTREAPVQPTSRSESVYREEVAEQLRQMQRANEQRQASAPAVRPAPVQQPMRRPAAQQAVPATARRPKHRPPESVPIMQEADKSASVADDFVRSRTSNRQQARIKLSGLSRDRLREAFVLKEVLDKPLALREEGGGLGGW